MSILAGCAGTPTTEYIYVEPDCQAPAIVDPKGFSWDDLTDVPILVSAQVDQQTYDELGEHVDNGTLRATVPITTLEDIDETVNTLIDEILVRQVMLEEICSPEGVE